MARLLLLILSTCAIVTITCLLCILILHFREHFRIQCCFIRNKILSHRASMPMLAIARQKKSANNNHIVTPITPPVYRSTSHYQSCIAPIDEESFDFFPVSFVSYLMLMICVTSLLLYKLIQIKGIFNISVNLIYLNHTHSGYFHLNMSDYHILDWIVIYAQILISLWDSIFSFYRYYTTHHCANYFHLLSFAKTLAYFCFYAVPYLLVSLLQIHIYYYLYPAIIIAHFTMNFWCNWMFAKILIDSTLQYAEAEKLVENIAIHQEMLRSVYFMRRTSILWCIISVLCHSCFIMTYSVDLMCFYPLLWCIGCVLFALNFVRNRSRIYETSFKIYQAFKHCSFHAICNFNNDIDLTEWQPQRPTVSTNNDVKNNESETDINSNNMESTVKSTEIKNEHALIDDVDVFEDEDEMMIYEYDDPLALIALNRSIKDDNMVKVKQIETRPRSVTLDKEKQQNTAFAFNMDLYSMSDPIDINKHNKQQHQHLPTLEDIDVGTLLEEKTVEIDLYGADDDMDDDDISYIDEEDEDEELEVRNQKRSNKALELLGLTMNKAISTKSNYNLREREWKLRERIRSFSGIHSDELPSTTTTIGHKRSLSQGHQPTGSDFAFDETKLGAIVDKIDEIREEKEEEDFEEKEANKFTLEITNKLKMIQRKSELHPTILRRLEYQRKLPSKPSKLKLKRSLSAPNSPRRHIAQYIQFSNTLQSLKKHKSTPSKDMMSYVKMNQTNEPQQEQQQHNHLSPHKLILERTGSAPLNSPKEIEDHNKSLFDNEIKTDIDEHIINDKKQYKHNTVKSSDHLAMLQHALVLQGFYSRKSLNNVQQLTKLKNVNKHKRYLTVIQE